MEPTMFQFCSPVTVPVEFDKSQLLDLYKFRTRSTGYPNSLSRLLNDLTREAAQNMPPPADTMATAGPPDATEGHVSPNQVSRKNRAHCSAELTPSEPLFHKSSHEDGIEAGSLPVVAGTVNHAGTGGSRRYGRRGGLSLALKGNRVPIASVAQVDTGATSEAGRCVEESKAVAKVDMENSCEMSFTRQEMPAFAVLSEEVTTVAREVEQRQGEHDRRAAGTSVRASLQAEAAVPSATEGVWQPPPGVVEFRLTTSSSSAFGESFHASKESRGKSRKVASALSMLLKGAANSSNSHVSAVRATNGIKAR